MEDDPRTFPVARGWTLTKEQIEELFDALENPPDPNDALKRAFARHKALIRSQT